MTPPLPHSKLCLKFLSPHPRQRKITHAPGSILFFENQFPPTTERGSENYDLLYLSSLGKYDVFVMAYDGKCDGFTVLYIISIR